MGTHSNFEWHNLSSCPTKITTIATVLETICRPPHIENTNPKTTQGEKEMQGQAATCKGCEDCSNDFCGIENERKQAIAVMMETNQCSPAQEL